MDEQQSEQQDEQKVQDEPVPRELAPRVLGRFIVLMATMFIGASGLLFAEGVCLMVLWEWFVVPAFGLEPISWTTALGLSLMFGVTTLKPSNFKIETENKGWRHLFHTAPQKMRSYLTTCSLVLAALGMVMGLGWLLAP